MIQTTETRPQYKSEFDSYSHLPLTSTTTHKGLVNLTGENNCFLNVTIQALWHLGPFRIELQKLMAYSNSYELQKKMLDTEKNNEINDFKKVELKSNKEGFKSNKEGKGNILAALCNLFVQYEFTNKSTLPTYEMRTILSNLSEQFQLGTIYNFILLHLQYKCFDLNYRIAQRAFIGHFKRHGMSKIDVY
jgi:hypothetical protein